MIIFERLLKPILFNWSNIKKKLRLRLEKSEIHEHKSFFLGESLLFFLIKMLNDCEILFLKHTYST